MITIRKATSDDKSRMHEILNSADFDEYCFENLTEHTMVVELENNIVGWGALDIVDNLALMKFVYILPDYRNQGLGDGLVRALINYADRRGVKNVYILSQYEYFKRFGFKQVAGSECDKKVLEKYSINVKDQFIMKLNVDDFFNGCHCH